MLNEKPRNDKVNALLRQQNFKSFQDQKTYFEGLSIKNNVGKKNRLNFFYTL